MTATSGGLKTSRRASWDAEPEETTLVNSFAASRKGTLTLEGDQGTITFERHIRHPVEAVWEALTEPEHLARWYMTQAQLDPRLGGRIDYISGPSHFHVTGKILTWDPPRVFEHEWNVEPRNELPFGEKSVLRYELTPDGDETILRVTHRRLNRGTARGFISGLHAFLDRLEQELDGVPLSDWQSRFAEVRPLYRTTGQ